MLALRSCVDVLPSFQAIYHMVASHSLDDFWQDVSVAEDGLSSELQGERQGDILLDSYISQSRHVKGERELERWVPDEDVPQRPELENIFDSAWAGL